MAGSFSQAQKRYKRAFIPVMVFYVVACFGGSYLRAQYETPPDWLSAIVALTMAAPVVAVLFLKLRLLSETDEYTRFRQARNMLFGAAFTVSVCTGWGFLELVELVPHMWTFLVAPIYFFSWGIASLFNRDGGPC